MSYITRQQAADRLSVSLRTLDGIIQRGSLPAYRIGPKLVRIDEKELEEYVAKHLVSPEPARRTGRPCRYVPGMKVV